MLICLLPWPDVLGLLLVYHNVSCRDSFNPVFVSLFCHCFFERPGRSETRAATVDDKAVDPLETASATKLAGALRVALTEIEPNMAEIFCLVGLKGMSNTDAAKQMGLTAKHAGELLHRAHKTLPEKLQQFAPVPRSRAT
jgi:predicted DNA-binding protein (UPF0251 family)